MDPSTSSAASPHAADLSASDVLHDTSDDVQDVHGEALPPPVPPYWRHYRTVSNASIDSQAQRANPITLEDNETERDDGKGASPLWAKSVTIEDYAVVKGLTGVGAYVVWTCRVQTLDGGPMTVRKRYSEFDELRDKLLHSFPKAKHSIPQLPPKSALYKFRPKFLERRREGLEYFLNCILLNPEFAGSPILKEFLFSHDNV